jgi:hypothetical protein
MLTKNIARVVGGEKREVLFYPILFSASRYWFLSTMKMVSCKSQRGFVQVDSYRITYGYSYPTSHPISLNQLFSCSKASAQKPVRKNKR